MFGLMGYLPAISQRAETNDPTGSAEVNAAFGRDLILFSAFVLSPVIMTLAQTYWLRHRRTIGKAIFGLQVVQSDGTYRASNEC